MTRIATFTRRRLARLRRRRQREQVAPAGVLRRSTLPFRYDASFHLEGVGRHHADITARTGLVPKFVHLKGELRRPGGDRRWPEDLWVLESPLGERASLKEHLDWLWAAVRPHKTYFEGLIAEASRADVWLGCLSESSYPVLQADAASLDIVRELKLGLRFNFTCI